MAAAEDFYKTPEPFEVPEGGLASFLTATEGDWADEGYEPVPHSGIANLKSIADHLAEYGRYEDEYMVHAAEGETVIPAEVLNANPRLKAKLFSQMKEMGIEPERYIVGNQLNSINPVTGQPEFFLKKIFKGVKNAVKGVVKVAKKVAPIALSLAGAAYLGPLGAALGSGVGTLIQGGDLKDALKAGLLSGAVAGIGQGISEGFSAASSGAETGLGNVGEFTSGFGKSVSEGLKGGYIDQFSSGLANLSGSAGEVLDTFGSEATVADPSATVEQALATDPVQASNVPQQAMFAGQDPVLEQAALQSSSVPQQTVVEAAQGQVAGAPSYFDRLQSDPLGTLTGSSAEPTVGQLAQKQQELINTFNLSPGEALNLAQDQLAPSLLEKYGTAAALATGVGAATGFFDTPPPPEPVDFYGGQTGFDLLEQDPEKYRVGLPTYGQDPSQAMPSMSGSSLGQYGEGVTVAQATGRAPTLLGYDAQGKPIYDDNQRSASMYNPYQSMPIGAADGGEITNFPRRIGAIYGPGTETSDDVPAMLSDGEFVMTARAVRNAGDGDREKGMMRMYEIMRKFEGGRV